MPKARSAPCGHCGRAPTAITDTHGFDVVVFWCQHCGTVRPRNSKVTTFIPEIAKGAPFMSLKPLLVGELNPYGADPDFALYPSPDGSAGHRLCTMVLGMSRKRYLDTFDRVNLCEGKWGIREARASARQTLAAKPGRGLVLCGAKVCEAFGFPFEPFTLNVYEETNTRLVIIPHPSGLCRLWSTEKDAVARARAAIIEAIPELQPFIGSHDE